MLGGYDLREVADERMAKIKKMEGGVEDKRPTEATGMA